MNRSIVQTGSTALKPENGSYSITYACPGKQMALSILRIHLIDQSLIEIRQQQYTFSCTLPIEKEKKHIIPMRKIHICLVSLLVLTILKGFHMFHFANFPCYTCEDYDIFPRSSKNQEQDGSYASR